MPVFALGNWIPFVLNYWGRVSGNGVLAQAVFTSEGKTAVFLMGLMGQIV